MIKYLTICTLIFFASCIKVENANLCRNAPAAPSLAQSSYQVSAGGTFSASVLSPDLSLTYSWLNPAGYIYHGSSITHTNTSYSDFGQWSVFSQKSVGCTSDTAKFSVTLGAGSCGIGRDTFRIDGGTYKIVSEQSSYYYYGGYSYYRMTFYCSNGASIVVNVPSQPQTSSIYYATDPNNSYLYSDQCTISLNGGNYYSSVSGNVTVIKVGSELDVTFCNAEFLNNGTYVYVYASGFLVGS